MAEGPPLRLCGDDLLIETGNHLLAWLHGQEIALCPLSMEHPLKERQISRDLVVGPAFISTDPLNLSRKVQLLEKIKVDEAAM